MRNKNIVGTYIRLDHNGLLKSADHLALIKDYSKRLDALEERLEELETTTPDRTKPAKVSRRKVSSS